ncbi:MAG TPA: helix-turn-helix domain-containing protein [Syntrophales bacterium]|mgnify:CR=1 FL=1|nr:helix-turn-helix domain-containing protein [Syntrophales bacterium]
MRTEFENDDIDRIAEKVMEKLLPLLQGQEGPDKIISAEELGQLIGKSKEQIYQWVNQSQHGFSDFPYMKAGKSLRFSQKEIVQWMRKRGKPLERR